MTQTIVETHQLSKRYGKLQALSDIDLSINEGEVLGLFGHNGAGKSTLMKLMLGLITPSRGELKVFGQTPAAGDDNYRCRFGYLPENVSFYEQLSGREVLRYFARLKGVAPSQADELLEEFGLSHAASRAVKTYSKGMRQRLGLAQTLLGEPRLLLLDEPTVGLDPVAAQDFYTTVDRLKARGCSLVVCSHVLPGIEAHIDRAMILGAGRQLALGSLEQLRSEAALPIEISTRGLSEDDLRAMDLLRYLPRGTTLNGRQRLQVPGDDKLSVLQRLSNHRKISDLEWQQPTLETLYQHYIARQTTECQQGATDE